MPQLKKTVLLIILFLTACQDWNYERVSFLQVITRGVTEVTANTALLEGSLTGLREGETVSQHGHVWSAKNPVPTLEDNEGKKDLGRQSDGRYTSDAKALRPNTRYYYRAYAVYQEEAIYGEVDTFSSKNFSVSIKSIQVDGGEAVVEWEVVSYLGDPDEFGVVWSATNEAPTLGGESVSRTAQSAPFLNCADIRCPVSDELTRLEPNTNYYLRTYLLPGLGQPPVYSEVTHFHTFPAPVGWAKESDYPGTPDEWQFVFAIQNKVYRGGGGSSGRQETWAYSPIGNRWSEISNAPSAVNPLNMFSFSLDGKVYFVGARPVTQNSVLVFDPAEPNAWRQLPAPPEKFAKAISNFSVVAVFTIHSAAYLLTWEEQGVIWKFNPTETAYHLSEYHFFQEPFLGRLPGFGLPDVFLNQNLVAGNKAYLFLPDQQSWELEVEAAGGPQWRPLDPFPEYWPDHAVPVNGKIYVASGNLRPIERQERVLKIEKTNHYWELDPIRSPGLQWRRMPDFPGPKQFRSHGVTTGGKGYVLFPGISEPTDLGRLLYKDHGLWAFTPPE